VSAVIYGFNIDGIIGMGFLIRVGGVIDLKAMELWAALS
jgi:hypothetical protein